MNTNVEHQSDPLEHLALEFIQKHPSDAARALEFRSDKKIAEFIEDKNSALLLQMLEKLHPNLTNSILSRLSPKKLSILLNKLSTSYLSKCLIRSTQDQQQNYLELIKNPSRKEELKELLSYAPDTAGGIMDTNVTTFSPTVTVKQVTSQLRKIRKRQLHMLVVTDENQKLLGIISLQTVILAQPTQQLGELITTSPVSLASTATQDEVNELFNDSRLVAVPVVNFDGQFLGLVRHGSVVRSIKDEVLTEMQTMVGVSKDERALSPPLTSVSKRLPWLNINLLTAFLAAAVVGAFEDTIASVTALAVLLPVVAGQSGNTGAQSLAVTMRGLALKEVHSRQWLKLAIKEAIVGAVNGAAIAFVCAIAVYFWSGSWGLVLIITVAMIFSMTIASVSGTVIPVILRRLGLDPAQSSSIILTTVTDIIGFMSFLGLATLLMPLI